jgi:hypothetical protein
MIKKIKMKLRKETILKQKKTSRFNFLSSPSLELNI